MATQSRPYTGSTTTTKTTITNDRIGGRVKCIMGSHVGQTGTVVAIPGTGRVSVKFSDGQIRTYNDINTTGAGVVGIRGRRPAVSPTPTTISRNRTTGKAVVKTTPRKTATPRKAAALRKHIACTIANGNAIGARKKVSNTFSTVKHRGQVGTVINTSATRYQLRMDNGSTIWVSEVYTSGIRGKRPSGK